MKILRAIILHHTEGNSSSILYLCHCFDTIKMSWSATSKVSSLSTCRDPPQSQSSRNKQSIMVNKTPPLTLKPFSNIKSCFKCCLAVSVNSSIKPAHRTEVSENVEMKAMFGGCAAFQEQAEEPFNFASYSLEKKLGSGAFGTVYKCKHRESDKRYAGKLYDAEFIKDSDNMDLVNSEVKILKRLSHRNTVSFVDLDFSRHGVLLVMELVEGRDLNEMVPDKVGVLEPFARILFFQLMEVVSYLHSQRIVHRDIKLENVLVDNRGTLKLIDYGLSDLIPESKDEKAGLIVSGLHGTRSYYPPEIVRAIEKGDEEAKFIGDKIDIWTSGVFLYTLVSGKHPFSEESTAEEFRDISHANIDYDGVDFSPELKDLLRSMLRVEPSCRVSIKEILNHPWSVGSRFDPTRDDVFKSATGRFGVHFADGAPQTIFSCPKSFPQFERLRFLSPKDTASCRTLIAWRQTSLTDTKDDMDENSSNSVESSCNSVPDESNETEVSQAENREGKCGKRLRNGYLALKASVRDVRDHLRDRPVRLGLRQQDLEQHW